MSTSAKPSRSAELAALAMATYAHGRVDLTAYEAHRLILQNPLVDDWDAAEGTESMALVPSKFGRWPQ